MRRLEAAILPALLALAAPPAHAEIFRCTSPVGAVTYQQDPCGASESARKVDVPASYPTPDSGERERLFAREAALDRRLEAQRDRWNREAIAHAMQPSPARAPETAGAPDVVWIGTPVVLRSHHHGFRPFPRRGGMRGGLRRN